MESANPLSIQKHLLVKLFRIDDAFTILIMSRIHKILFTCLLAYALCHGLQTVPIASSLESI